MQCSLRPGAKSDPLSLTGARPRPCSSGASPRGSRRPSRAHLGGRRGSTTFVHVSASIPYHCCLFSLSFSARNIEQGATHASGLPISLKAAAAKERMRVGTSHPLISRSRGVIHKKQGDNPGRFDGLACPFLLERGSNTDEPPPTFSCR